MINRQRARQYLQSFRFEDLFIEELGWSNPASTKTDKVLLGEQVFVRRPVAQLSGIQVFVIQSDDGNIPDRKTRLALHQEIARHFYEHLLIFLNQEQSQSVWSWIKRNDGKRYLRTHHYAKWQDPDLHLGKITGLFVAMSELDDKGQIPLVEVAHRLRQSLDIEQVTKKFFVEFKDEHDRLMAYLESSIADEKDRRWYTSALLNRIMFIYFLQRQRLVDNGATDYLRRKLEGHEWQDRYYDDFLTPLFFEGFALPESKRSAQAKAVLGMIPYMNGGLFLKHAMEIKYAGQIHLPDQAFAGLYELLDSYTWHLDDRPGQNSKEINPDVLGYIFEKYINQKAFGAYYTRPEITEYLCEQTIHQLVVEKMREIDRFNFTLPPLQYEDVHELLLRMDGKRCHILLRDILPKLSLLDPACGSGAFLVAAMKTLVDIYQVALGRAEFSDELALSQYLQQELTGHPNKTYYIKKKIITHNLYGVDIMDEAVEIARLRLFLALVSAIKDPSHLEPLPNIDFNILPGNSLIGLLRIDEATFDQYTPANGDGAEQVGIFPAMKQGNLFGTVQRQSYRQMVNEKNRLIRNYRLASTLTDDVETMRTAIQSHRNKAQGTLNQILLDEFGRLGIKYEQATWDSQKNDLGKPLKHPLTITDMAALQPFHWGYEFDEVMNERNGFDAIITNPPWEAFKPQAKEFFADFANVVSKNKMRIEDFLEKQAELLQQNDIREAWLVFLSRFPYQSKYFGESPQYMNQRMIVSGRKTSGDVNLYKLFTEQGYNLLRDGGLCGTVIPSGIYTDLGTTGLREMLFEKTRVEGLFGFENRKQVFEGVDTRFKFVVLTFTKGGKTVDFPAAFMRHDVTELLGFPEEGSLSLSVDLIRKLSPDSQSITEFKDSADVAIARKLMKYPFLSGDGNGWQLELYGEELHMNRASGYFKTAPTSHSLYEGSMIWHFDHRYSKARYWLNETELRQEFLEKRLKRIKNLTKQPEDLQNDYQTYRLAIRKIASNTNERTLITTVVPKNVFAGNSLAVHFPFQHTAKNYNTLRFSHAELLALAALLNSFVTDYVVRARMTTNLNTFYLYQLPVPRLTPKDSAFRPIVERSAKLICTSPEFDEVAVAVGLNDHTNGVTDPITRAQLRAELDGLIAHVYGLAEDEFEHILSTFPLVAEEVKKAALNEYRRLAPAPGLMALIASGETRLVEFKVGAFRNPYTGKQDNNMRNQVLWALAAFLNSAEGGTLLLGIENNGSILGVDVEYPVADSSKPNRDGYELALRNMINHKLTAQFSPFYTIDFYTLEGKDVCRFRIKPAPQPAYVDGELYIRDGNKKQKLTAQEAMIYVKQRW